MSRQILAIALCRVSSIEQLQNNSLKHQKDNVLKAAEGLGAVIPQDGLWEGQRSSKQGVNFDRKDLLEMYDYCKKNSSVKYLIVQEVDRFMRSPDEQTYWYVKFLYELKVKIWFADKPELNADTHEASLFRYLEGWRAGGSNVERISKSINGQTAALREGRWTFVPKPGYMKGRETGIPEVHPVKGSALKTVLVNIASHMKTPSQALVDLNNSEFMTDGHSEYKMDKFRKIVTDPFYAGILEINKQVQVRNENGLHQPLITKEQHFELVKIMEGKPKNQSGPRKNGNPKYPANNIVQCDKCLDKRNGRVVGFDHTNGKSSKIYEKYRCRACRRYVTRQELHSEIARQFDEHQISHEGIARLLEALDTVWRQKEGESEQEIVRLSHRIKSLGDSINQQVEAATDPSNASIKDEILAAIGKKKAELEELDDQLVRLQTEGEADKSEFIKFALNFVGTMGSQFFEISQENRLRCKQVIFPAGFYLDTNNKVYTPEVSPLITLVTKKKDAEASENSHMVRVRRL
jgi:DNA invertase Pin-like site-specific DNA recombinase